MAETKQRINSNIKLFEIVRKNVCVLTKKDMDECYSDRQINQTLQEKTSRNRE